MKKILLKGERFALVDNEDFERLNQFNWSYFNTGYVARCVKGKPSYIHREIMNPLKGFVVDHINRNKLDNRKENLRICTRKQNSQNSKLLFTTNKTGFRGVVLHKSGKWRARISVDNKTKNIGYFKNKIDAAKAYNNAAKMYHGKFASLNPV